MECPKCKRKMLGGVDLGRQSDGSAGPMLSAPMYYCYNCSTRVAIERPPAMVIDRAGFGVCQASRKAGGRQAGFDSPASLAAVKFFDSITDLRKQGCGWIAITRLLVIQSGTSFSDRALQKHYDKALDRREDEKRLAKLEYNRQWRMRSKFKAEVSA